MRLPKGEGIVLSFDVKCIIINEIMLNTHISRGFGVLGRSEEHTSELQSRV
jgi:hypothetical protein